MHFFKAAILGCMVAIPIGPVGLLVIQRSIKVGPLRGLASGLGAALADGLFGFLAALGMVSLFTGLEGTRHFVRPLGSLVLMGVGTYFFFQKPPPLETEEVLSTRYLSEFLWDTFSTFLLTLTNPATIIAFAALFAGSELIPDDPRKLDYVEISAGITAGSFLWWCLLVALAQPIKKILSPNLLHRLMQVLGTILVTLAVISLTGHLGEVVDKLRRLFG